MTLTRLTFTGKVPKILQGDPKLKSAVHSAWRSIEQVCTFFSGYFLLILFFKPSASKPSPAGFGQCKCHSKQVIIYLLLFIALVKHVSVPDLLNHIFLIWTNYKYPTAPETTKSNGEYGLLFPYLRAFHPRTTRK